MAKKRKNFIREKRIYCGEEYLEVDIVAVTNMPEAGKGKKGKSSQTQKNLNDKRSKRRFVQIANTNFGTNDFHISATYNNEHLPIASIDKTPEPFRVTSKNHRTGEFTGRFSTHAQPDFQGTLYGGRSIMFEAKRTSKDRITRNVLTDTQMDVLEKHSRLGALCGVCICIQDDFFFIPWNVWRDMKEMYGRQYLKPDDIEEYKVKFDGAVHFLMHTEELKGAYENAERKR